MAHRPLAAGSILFSLLAKTCSRLFRWSGWHGVCHGPRKRRWKIGHRLAIDCTTLGALRDICLFWLGTAACRYDTRGLDRVVVECRSGIQFCRSACGTRASGLDVCPVGHACGMAGFGGEERQPGLVDRGGPVFWRSLVVCLCGGCDTAGHRCHCPMRAKAPPSRGFLRRVRVAGHSRALPRASADVEFRARVDSHRRRNVSDRLGIQFDGFSSLAFQLDLESFAAFVPRDSSRVVPGVFGVTEGRRAGALHILVRTPLCPAGRFISFSAAARAFSIFCWSRLSYC